MRDGWKNIAKMYCILAFVTYARGFLEPNLFPDKGNIWEYLAQEVLNTTDFCLMGGRSVKDILITCLLGVASGPQTIINDTKLRNIPLMATYSTIFNWGTSSNVKDRSMYTLLVATVTNSVTCFKLAGCRAPRVPTCQNLSNTELTCNHIETIPFSYSHMRLPSGWFLLCGIKAYSYLPANSTGGPCTLGRLTMLMPSLQRWQRKDLQSLNSECDSKSLLLSKAEYMALVASLAEVPALAVHNSRNLNSLACALAKSLNSTSQALDALNQELRQVEDATLENRAAIDYLLLRHNHGCKEFHSMCCFNLTEQTELIENDIRHRKELAQNIRYGIFPFELSGVFSGLPNLNWLKVIILGTVTATVVVFSLCCLCRCISPCRKCQRTCLSTVPKTSEKAIQVSLMMSQPDSRYLCRQDLSCAKYLHLENTNISTKWGNYRENHCLPPQEKKQPAPQKLPSWRPVL